MNNIAKYIFFVLILNNIAGLAKASNGKEAAKKIFIESMEYAVSKNIIDSYYQLTMINDLNPLLGLISNDEGYTIGISHNFRILHNKKQRFYDFALSSDLFTDYHYNDGYAQDGKWIVPQSFTEINTLQISINQYIKRKKLFAAVAIGTGVRNKNHAIPGFALYLQGGKDGKGGYHSTLSMHANENLVTGEIKPFVYLAPSIRKQFIHNNRQEFKEPFYLDYKLAFRLAHHKLKALHSFRCILHYLFFKW